jgi:hypothetical protein
VYGAGLAPLPQLDGLAATDDGAASVALALEGPPVADRGYVPSGSALVLVITVVFTVAAGVSSFAVDFAKAASTIF